ncbi:MAG: hypothetical protein ACM3UZ_12035 [Acidobacteriota bacterium]
MQKEVIRLLHNFLAASASLVDHTRILAKDLYSNSPFWNEYNATVKATFAESPISNFVKDLRNYFLHTKIPVISATLVPIDEQMDSYINLHLDELRNWDGWKKKSKEYLASQPSKIRLEVVCDDYWSIVESLYKWFADKQNIIHLAEFEQAKEIQNQMKIALDKFRSAPK